MFWKLLILVSENGEVACMDTTLHWLQQPFFLVSQFPGFLVLLCSLYPCFDFISQLAFCFTHGWWLFLVPLVNELFSGSSLKMGPPFGMIQIKYKYKYKFMVIFCGSHFPYCIGLGLVIHHDPHGRVAWHLWPSNAKPSRGVMPGHGCCDVAVKGRARRGTVVERAETLRKLRWCMKLFIIMMMMMMMMVVVAVVVTIRIMD